MIGRLLDALLRWFDVRPKGAVRNDEAQHLSSIDPETGARTDVWIDEPGTGS